MKTLIQYLMLSVSVAFLIFPVSLKAQKKDTLTIQNEKLDNDLEDLARSNDGVQDYSDLVDDYEYYSRHPININGPNVEELVKLRLLNEAQLFSIQSYIKNNAPFKSVYELKFIPGLSIETLQRLSKYVVAGKPGTEHKISMKELLKFGRSDVLMRYQQVLEPEAGYDISSDSAYLKPGSVYLGTPQKLYFRYSFHAMDRFRIGITAEKDAGEVFLKRTFSDSVNKMLGHKPAFPDFLSAYAFISDVGIIKKAVVGDYHLEFGQGLTLWSGLAFGASSQTCQVKYFGKGIRPNTSANENRYFRGAAVTLEKKGFELTAFYSKKNYDANLLPPDSMGIRAATSLQETGYHRTINELQDKNAMTITVYGGQLAYRYKRFRVGAIYYQTHLDHPLSVSSTPYKLFDFHGDALTNFGLNLNFNVNPVSFFGEIAANPGGKPAGLAGLNAFLSDRFTLTLFYRNYPKDYHVIFASPFGKSSGVANERGIYLGFNALLTKSLTLSGYVDHYYFPWLKFRVDAPSHGKSYLLQMNDLVNNRLSINFRFRFNKNELDLTDSTGYFSVPVPEDRYDFRLGTSYALFNFLILRNRVEYVKFQEEGNPEKGFMAFQDIKLKRENASWQAVFRYALFNTDGWNSRIYTFENNALYTFSIPALSGHGERIYLLLSWAKIKNIKIWLRAATTIYFDRSTISSGPSAIDTKHKSTITCELQWKL